MARTRQLRRLEAVMRDEWSLLSADIVAASAEELEILLAEYPVLEAEVAMLQMEDGAVHATAAISSGEDVATRV